MKRYFLIGLILSSVLYGTGHNDQEALLVACSCSLIFPLAYHGDLNARTTVVLERFKLLLLESPCNYPCCWYKNQAIISIEKVLKDR